MKKKSIISFAILILVGLSSIPVFSQSQRRIIQLSGVILGQDGRKEVYQLPGVHVYVPKAGRGTTTNSLGFFSMPVLAGDSIIVSSIG
ncbi:MAG: carboxypeptidase-like regulatory domain-containing protein, partial [Cyclobacteriaceae bacterium]|nr:carboxypeptidase-like regulatory domain-containing protein [Cyclobacteriaceae bacterium]